MNCSEYIVGRLKAAGTNMVFGYPGDPSVAFLEACRQSGMEFVLGTREGTAGLMAQAYGQITDAPGVCLSTLGPGSSNLVNAVANAYLDRVPMIALSGQIESKREPVFTHQVLDHNRLFAPVSKWTATVQPHTVAPVLRRAIRTAMAERPGSVHLTTPADMVGAPLAGGEEDLPPVEIVSQGYSVVALDAGVDPARKLRDARRPIILAGISAMRSKAGPAIEALAEKIGCPIVIAPMAKGTVNERHPYFAGTLDMACNDFVWEFLKQADLLLNVGFDAVELIKPWTVRVPTIHIDTTPNTDQIYPAEIEIIGPIAGTLSFLADAISSGAERWSEAEIAAHRAKLRALYLAGRVAGRLNPTDVVETVLAASGPQTRVTTDVGSHKLLVGQGWVAERPKAVLMTNGLSSMGYSLPAAMTAQMLERDRHVICFTGDGGLAMVQGELRLAATLKLPLTVIVFCDNSLNRIELKQTTRQLPSYGTRMEPTDIPMLARSMACDGVAVDSAAALERLLAEPRTGADRPLVIGAQIDPAQYAAQF